MVSIVDLMVLYETTFFTDEGMFPLTAYVILSLICQMITAYIILSIMWQYIYDYIRMEITVYI
jgi:hypothetical protein